VSPAPYALADTLFLQEEQDLGRRRFQQRGDLYEQGGWWKLRWKEDQIDAEGNIKRDWSRPVVIGPCQRVGSQKPFTEKEARRIAWDNHLSRLDQNRAPQSIMSVADFVERYFATEHVAMLKPGGRVHYSTMLPIVLEGIPAEKTKQRKWVKDESGKKIPPPAPKRLFGLGEMRLRDVKTEHCQRLVSAALSRGYSVQYATHIRNAISAIFEHADSKEWFTSRNPTKHVKLPENVPAPQSALTFDQLRAVAAALDPLTRTMAVCASLTSMNGAEICGLKWKYVNLTEQWKTADGESLHPGTMAVRWQWTLGQLGTVKAGKRKRFVPIPPLLAAYLGALAGRGKFVGPDDYVFTVTGRTPVDQKNLLRRRLIPVSKALGFKLGWHTFRRTFDTLADQVGMSIGERQAIMGHSDQSMTMRYTKTTSEQARKTIEEMAKLIEEKPN
jgi:integrase